MDEPGTAWGSTHRRATLGGMAAEAAVVRGRSPGRGNGPVPVWLLTTIKKDADLHLHRGRTAIDRPWLVAPLGDGSFRRRGQNRVAAYIFDVGDGALLVDHGFQPHCAGDTALQRQRRSVRG